ncbi:hypothetical protein COW36_12700 [bacterium (Candidatus Blackallbacteria) CG17_big_fil_post_rev_8_21_14_2_50_48_46]|uniref:DUF7832 domain-containing protein n=1 Tax=bacterium (Candidatus Blackallbacteria) CG17_big_fil_post_rev_8_21_14_2_50_48_46 TaxID=2014261 RepID=A0A2M7G428_9BACT|nr:MAG: hypothetical protein COW64_02560 [bacterium (Candidatus Blackallbacteria) CG18_big_fil_WC_8_21_14_2_50_49_26]PIW16620.1 MAG: hypothetical protein COW36_12700 [bacterium (Candidatus Blackallbacteria) CG17_big_fil_post_rev_8_21_14_2_50_48_46]PIW46128.1 MAG: hypothetical protein COW20_17965 [bacterium (Candidatus Blackallbacteria) CG13_big_fil_rev_8_21_14_2_50_49_14]
MAYDKIKWHLQADYPKDLPAENAGTHIGMFLAWCFGQGWAGALHLENSPEAVAGVIKGELSGRKFLEAYCEGVFTEEDLNAEGNAFAHVYYESEHYLEDFQALFADYPTLYHVTDDQQNIQVLAKRLAKRYRKWSQRQKTKKAESQSLVEQGSAVGILDRLTGEWSFTQPDFRLGPQTTPERFLASEVGKRAVLEVDNPPWRTWRLEVSPHLGEMVVNLSVCFKGDKPDMLTIRFEDPDPIEDPWGGNQARIKLLEKAWLRQILAETREFDWGFISDSPGGGIYVRYL